MHYTTTDRDFQVKFFINFKKTPPITIRGKFLSKKFKNLPPINLKIYPPLVKNLPPFTLKIYPPLVKNLPPFSDFYNTRNSHQQGDSRVSDFA